MKAFIRFFISSKLLETYRNRFTQDNQMQTFLNEVISQKKLEKDDGATMFFTAEKLQNPILNVSLDSLIVKE